MFDQERTVRAMKLEFDDVRVEPSPVVRSPFEHITAYLTDQGPDGPHIIVSDAREWGDEAGWLVGGLMAYDEDGDVLHRESLTLAMDEVRTIAKELMDRHVEEARAEAQRNVDGAAHALKDAAEAAAKKRREHMETTGRVVGKLVGFILVYRIYRALGAPRWAATLGADIARIRNLKR